MRTGSLLYLIKEGFRNIIQNQLMALATVGTLLSCLLLIGCSVLFTVNVNALVGYVESQNEVIVFIRDDIDGDQIDALKSEIGALDNIAAITFIDRDVALSEWMEKLGQSSELYEYLKQDNPLPHSFSVKVKSLEELDITLMHVDGMYGVDKVRAPTEVSEAVSGIKQASAFISVGLVGILVTVSLVIVANTIRITVFSRRREISIMRYVGATNLFIRLPFLFEGVILGLLAGVLAFLFIWAGYASLMNWTSKSVLSWAGLVAGNVVPFKSVAYRLLAAFLATGSGIGAVGSMLFIGKHIKV